MPEVKLYETDYVLFKDNKPVDSLDIIYAKESVEELFEDGFELERGERFIRMTELPIEWQEKYIAEIITQTNTLLCKCEPPLHSVLKKPMATSTST